jgi:cytochrome P450
MLIELNKDPQLLKAVREEVATAFETDPATGVRTLDQQKVVGLPLLNSLLTEVLRLRVSMVIMRVAEKPMVINGVNVPQGALIHAYSRIAQTDEDTWGAPGHPASEFWPERHIKYVEERDASGQVRKKREFVMAASAACFFPFGTSAVFLLKCSTWKQHTAQILTAVLLQVAECQCALDVTLPRTRYSQWWAY